MSSIGSGDGLVASGWQAINRTNENRWFKASLDHNEMTAFILCIFLINDYLGAVMFTYQLTLEKTYVFMNLFKFNSKFFPILVFSIPITLCMKYRIFTGLRITWVIFWKSVKLFPQVLYIPRFVLTDQFQFCSLGMFHCSPKWPLGGTYNSSNIVSWTNFTTIGSHEFSWCQLCCHGGTSNLHSCQWKTKLASYVFELCCCNFINTKLTKTLLWISDAILRETSWPIWVQIMACCLTAPSHCLNKYWLTIYNLLNAHDIDPQIVF